MTTRTTHPVRAILLAAFLLLLSGGAGALPAQAPPADADGAELSVYLLTMGQGDLVWEKFGHNAIWIHDPVAGTDHVYNFGVFDFNSPGYWGRFFRGDWIYQLAVYDIQETLAQYRYFDRTVVAQELDLTAAEKSELQGLLEINARPENREYLYDYYRDNCSTRVRDVLDRVTGGALSRATTDVATGTTYRWHSRRLIASDRLAYAGLMAGLGPAADRPISAWEAMFLPTELMERVRETVVVRDGAARPLVASERTLYSSTGRAAERETPPSWFFPALLIGVMLGIAMLGLGRAAEVGSGAGRFGFALLTGLWGLLVGTGGLMLVGLWAFTNHTIAHANENLLQVGPLSLALALLVPALGYGARWAARPAWWVAVAVAALATAGFVLQAIPGVDQVNGEVIAVTLPAHLGLALAVRRLARRE